MSKIIWKFPENITLVSKGEYSLFSNLISGDRELNIDNLSIDSIENLNYLYIYNISNWKIFKFKTTKTQYVLKLKQKSLLTQKLLNKKKIPIILENGGKYLYTIKYPLKIPGFYVEIEKITITEFTNTLMNKFEIKNIVYPNLSIKNKYHLYDYSFISKIENAKILFIFQLLVSIDTKYFNLDNILQIIYTINPDNINLLNKCYELYKFPEIPTVKITINSSLENRDEYNFIPRLVRENLELFYRENILLKCHLLNYYKLSNIDIIDPDNMYLKKFKEIEKLCEKMYLNSKNIGLKCINCEIIGDYTTLLGEYKYNICRWCFRKGLDCFLKNEKHQSVIEHEKKLLKNNWKQIDIIKQRPSVIGY